jgi:hypothetical protein
VKKTTAVALLLLASIALAAKGYSLSTTRYEIDDCATGGDTAVAPVAGVYLLRVLDEDTFICVVASGANTCASGGDEYPVGTVIPVEFGSTVSLNCRGNAGTGDVKLQKVR